MSPQTATGAPRSVGRVAKWIAVCAIVASVVQGVWRVRGLYADGSWFFLNELNGGLYWGGDPLRIFAAALTQAPVLLAEAIGVSEVCDLARLHTFGLTAVPAALWMAALISHWKTQFFWPLTTAYAVVALNSGFFAVGEYNVAYGLAALSAGILLRRNTSYANLAALICLAIVGILCYPAMAFLGPALAVIATVRLKRLPSVTHGRYLREARALMAVIILYLVATGIACYSIIFPHDAGNAASATDLRAPLEANRQLVVSVLIGVMAVLISRGNHVLRYAGAAACIGFALVLLSQPSWWATPHMHYEARSVVGLWLFALLLSLAPMAGSTARETPNSALPQVAASLALIAATFVPFAVRTEGFGRFGARFERVVLERSGKIAYNDSGLSSDDPNSWPWTSAIMSQILQERPQNAIVESEFPAPWLPKPLPKPKDGQRKQVHLFLSE